MANIYYGRPQDIGGRTPAEMRVYDYLDGLGIEYERADHDAVNTMEECNEIERFSAPTMVCKNLFLTNSKGDEFFLLMMRSDKRFVGKQVAHQIGSTRLSFASAEKMDELLGVHPGAVSVMGLMNDTGHRVSLLVDSDVLKDEYIGCHPCVNTSSLRMKTADVFGKFVPATGHNYVVVNCG